MAVDKSLKMDLPALAEMLRSKGRGKDTILAHITPKEAALLKRRGGSGTTNPDTGLPEFEDYGGSYDYSAPAPVSPTYDVVSGSGAQQTFTPTAADTGVPVQVAPSYQPGGESFYPSVSPAGNAAYDYLTPRGQTVPMTYDVSRGIIPTGAPSTPTLTPTSPVTPGVVSPEQQAAAPVTQAPPKPGEASFTDQLKAALTPTNLAKLGLVGALGAYGANRARLGGTQTQAATQQQQNIAQPYQQQGAQLTGAALRGELTPQSQQAYQAAQAQINQGIANRGGVGQQQAANQLASIYQNLLNNQYTYGLQVSQIGDNISLGAIRTGLQLDQQLNQATTGFYTQLAALAAGATVIPSTARG
jgi:hypothetical protein